MNSVFITIVPCKGSRSKLSCMMLSFIKRRKWEALSVLQTLAGASEGGHRKDLTGYTYALGGNLVGWAREGRDQRQNYWGHWESPDPQKVCILDRKLSQAFYFFNSPHKYEDLGGIHIIPNFRERGCQRSAVTGGGWGGGKNEGWTQEPPPPPLSPVFPLSYVTSSPHSQCFVI